MIDPRIEDYIEQHTSPEPELLYELRRQTYLRTPYPRMLSGPVQGRFLEMISRMIKPVTILEIGTFTGYSAICLAQGLAGGGLLHTIEANPVFADLAESYFEKAGLSNRIVLHRGEALSVLPNLDGLFDLVFIDAAKEQYLDYYQMVFDKVKTGGFILADNTLWDGRVLENEDVTDPETAGIIRFNRFVNEDERVTNVLLSVRDGILIIQKIV
ncbi:MAG TPA: O-methyltransferase [Bacteroidales bacterium]|nr:O-methyltransferase [Bacteroidales bacterium]HPM93238.1 O-methyltransferase [Bacteroidales bacterium]